METGNHTRQIKNLLTSVGIEPTTSGLDLPSLCRLSYKVAQRKSGTILDGESRRRESKGGGKQGHIVAETLLLMTFLCARKLENICCGHKMFLNKIRNIFVSRTQNLWPQQMLRARANGETFVSVTMCPQQCVFVCQYLKGTYECCAA